MRNISLNEHIVYVVVVKTCNEILLIVRSLYSAVYINRFLLGGEYRMGKINFPIAIAS